MPVQSKLTLITSRKSKTNLDIGRDSYTSSSSLRWGLVGAWSPAATGYTGAKLIDISGGRNDGVLTNMDPATDWVKRLFQTKAVSGLDFDNVDDYILTTKRMPQSPPLTLYFFGYFRSLQQYDGLVFSRGTGAACGLNINGAGWQLGYHWNDDSSTWSWNGGPAVPTATNCLLVITITSSLVTAYSVYNNQLFSATNSYSHVSNVNTNVINIGRDPTGGRFFDGIFYEAGVYTRALSSSQVFALYKLGPGWLAQDKLSVTPIITTL